MRTFERVATVMNVRMLTVERLRKQYGPAGLSAILAGSDPQAAVRFGTATHGVLQEMAKVQRVDAWCIRALGVDVPSEISEHAIITSMTDVIEGTTCCEMILQEPDGVARRLQIGQPPPEEQRDEWDVPEGTNNPEYDDALAKSLIHNTCIRLNQERGFAEGKRISFSDAPADRKVWLTILVDEIGAALSQGGGDQRSPCAQARHPCSRWDARGRHRGESDA